MFSIILAFCVELFVAACEKCFINNLQLSPFQLLILRPVHSREVGREEMDSVHRFGN